MSGHDHIPKRGPRVMHGAGALAAQARTIGGVSPQNEAAQALRDTQALTERFAAACKRLNSVAGYVDAFREQLAACPDDQVWDKRAINAMLDVIEEAAKGER